MIGDTGGNSGDVNLDQAKNVPGEADTTARRTLDVGERPNFAMPFGTANRA